VRRAIEIIPHLTINTDVGTDPLEEIHDPQRQLQRRMRREPIQNFRLPSENHSLPVSRATSLREKRRCSTPRYIQVLKSN
jgi:hypothetical protein